MIRRQQEWRFLHDEHVFHSLRRLRIDRSQRQHFIRPTPKLRLRFQVRHFFEPRRRFRRRTAQHQPIHPRELHLQDLHPPRQIARRRFDQCNRLFGLGRFDRIVVRIVEVQVDRAPSDRRLLAPAWQRPCRPARGLANRAMCRTSTTLLARRSCATAPGATAAVYRRDRDRARRASLRRALAAGRAK